MKFWLRTKVVRQQYVVNLFWHLFVCRHTWTEWNLPRNRDGHYDGWFKGVLRDSLNKREGERLEEVESIRKKSPWTTLKNPLLERKRELIPWVRKQVGWWGSFVEDTFGRYRYVGLCYRLGVKVRKTYFVTASPNSEELETFRNKPKTLWWEGSRTEPSTKVERV